MEPDKMISTRIAAQRLGLKPHTLENWRAKGDDSLKWSVIGNRTVRYSVLDVEEFRKRNTREQKTKLGTA
jgi:hypothetical protein